MTKIRDFIYLDVEKLYSLYSQVFEGVTDHIIQSFIDGLTHKNVEGGTLFKKGDFETEIVEISRRTENKFLFDHMYNKLEEKLSPSIILENQITSKYFQEIPAKSFLIKVVGKAKIMDYERLRNFTGDYDNLAEAITYITNMSSGDLVSLKEEIRRRDFLLTQVKDKNQKTKVDREIMDLSNTYWKKLNELKRNSNMYLDQDFLKYLSSLIQKFYFDNFELIFPSSVEANLGYRGILDKKWLRLQPDFLQALFGSQTYSDLIMVGQITYLPMNIVDLSESKPDDVTGPVESSMRDSTEAFIQIFRDFERRSSESAKRIDFITWPIAIYRETELVPTEQ